MTDAYATVEAPPGSPPHGDSPGSIFTRFLKFGLLAWGGPAAQTR